jgi:hypothetical protein
LAKLSGRTRIAQVAKVSSPLSSTGAIVSITSRTRRSTSASKMMTAMAEYAPACRKASTTVSPEELVLMGPSLAFGATCRTAAEKRRRNSLSVRPLLGSTCRRARPSLVIQSSASSGGSASTVTGLATEAEEPITVR